MSKETDNGSILCFLSDWKDRVSDGPRNKGDKITYRFSVSVGPNSWMLTEHRGDLSIHHVYAGSFRDMVPSLKTIAGLKAAEGIKTIQEALEKVANLKPNLKPLPSDSDIEVAMDFADQVDSLYQTDFTIHDGVRERYFGSGSEDEE